MTVVVSPLIALMKDQIDFLQRSGIDAARLDSSLDAAEQREIFDRLRAGSLKLLYVAPERFNNERFLAQLARARISLFAVDEAHCISEWGHNFRPDYLKLAERARELAAERVLALTATATPAVVADIRAGFGIEEADAVVTGFYRPNLTLLTTPVAAGERDGLLVERLRERPPGSTIVYVTLQRTSLRVATLLAAAGLPARAVPRGHERGGAGRGAGVVVGLAGGDRRRDDRVRDGDRQGRRPLRLPLQPAEEPRVVLAGDRARRPRRRAESICELFACPDDVPTLENFAFGDTPTREALAGLLADVLEHPVGAEFAVSEYELSDAPRPAPARAEDGAHLPRARRRAPAGNAVLRGLPAASARRGVARGRLRPLRRVARRVPAPRRRDGQDGADLDDARARRRGGGSSARSAAGSWRRSSTSTSRASSSCNPPSCASATRCSRARSSEAELVDRLVERFARRERAETARIESVLELVTHDGCQVARARRLLRRDAHGAVRALQPLPDRPRPAASRARAEAADRGEPRQRRARARSRDAPSRRARDAEAAGALPRRDHEPGDDAREADPRPALRLARRAAVRRRARRGRRRLSTTRPRSVAGRERWAEVHLAMSPKEAVQLPPAWVAACGSAAGSASSPAPNRLAPYARARPVC